MPIDISVPDLAELKPRITVFGVGGGGCNAVNNMISSNLTGVEFVVANTDAQALAKSPCERKIQMGVSITQGLGAGSQPEIGAAAAEETKGEIIDHLAGSHMVFITAGMGGGTGTGAAPVIASLAREQGILTVGVVTKPFNFEGRRRMAIAERGIENLAQHVDTLIVIPNQNLFRVANEATSFTAAFQMADQVLFSGVASITELMTKEGLINLDFADVRAVMSDMGKAMMGTGEASGENRAEEAALAAISNPLLDIDSMAGARGVLISIAGGPDLTLYEVDQAASRIREEVDPEANIIVGATIEEDLEGTMRVSVVATGLQQEEQRQGAPQTQAGNTRTIGVPGMSVPAGVSAGVYQGTPAERAPAAPAGAEKGTDAEPRSADEADATPQSAPQAPRMRPAADSEPAREDMELPLEEPAHEEPKAQEAGPAAPRPEMIAPEPHQPAPTAPHVSRPAGKEATVRIPDVDEMPSPIRELAKEKQERIKAVGMGQVRDAQGPRKRDRILGRVKELFGRGHSAPQPASAPAQASAPHKEPQAQVVNGPVQPGSGAAVSAQGMGEPVHSPLDEDDGLTIPAFLRRK